MALASVALAQARTLLNDDTASVWSDASLIPKLQIAHQELQMALWEVGSPAVRKESGLLAVTASVSVVDMSGTTPPQPSDMLAPTKIYEYTVASVYVGEMTEVFYLPLDVAVSAALIYWCWRKEKILFLGCSLDRKVKIQYRKLITVPTVAGADLGLSFAELYLGPRVAALAAGSVGNAEVLGLATEMAKANFQKVVSAHRGQQTPISRP